MMRAGIDEAGRGPVIGPMVMAILACDEKDEQRLQALGVKDSKMLSAQERERIFEVLTQEFAHQIIALSPAEIDLAVNGKLQGDNLNKLEARTSALLIHKLLEQSPIKTVIVDSPTKSSEKHAAEIQLALTKLGVHEPVKLQCEIKADANHLVVGAASILAKVTRDAHLRELEGKHGALGSGYPSDPTTQQYLAKNWQEGHEFFRKSWESYKRLANGAPQSSLADFGPKADGHADVIAAFEVLKDHGFSFVEPTNPYEVVRMKKDKTTLIRYTTGKVVVQGGEQAHTEQLLKKLDLL